MSIGDFGLYDSDGLIKGSYVYMLLCRDNGPVYVKVGITDNIKARLENLRHGCPVTPHQFLTMKRPNRGNARRVEAALHKALNAWRQHGEWFKVELAEKPCFNEAIRAALAKHIKPGYPCRWDRVAVQPLIRHGQARQAYYRKIFVLKGSAYADFKRDCRE
jgi:predicted GIY-YIG superfamily endonuclease